MRVNYRRSGTRRINKERKKYRTHSIPFRERITCFPSLVLKYLAYMVKSLSEGFNFVKKNP
jgi:hypothetical protein